MSSPEEDLVKVAGDVVSAPIRDFLQKLTGPWAEEIGLAFGDVARVYRFKRAVRLLEKVKKILEDAGINPHGVNPRILLPIIECASLEGDEDLHDRWANLLANAANPDIDDEVLPAFSGVLRDLLPYEVRILDRIYEFALHVEPGRFLEFNRDLGDYGDIIDKFIPEGFLPEGDIEEEEDRSAPLGNKLLLIFNNFIRLGIIEEHTFTKMSTTYVPGERFETETRCELTTFGFIFLKACHNPRKKTGSR